MDYKDYDDGELFMLVCEDDENAKEILFNKYKPGHEIKSMLF